MQLWIETTNLSLIEKGAKSGLIQAAVIPPAFFVKEVNPLHMIQQFLDIQPGFVVIDVLSDFMKIGHKLSQFSPRIVLRIPVKEEALEPMALLKKEGIPVMAGGVFSFYQALLAAKLGASYISAHFLRMVKMGDHPFEQMQAIQTLLHENYPQTSLVALHPKTAEHLKECAKIKVYGSIVREECYQELIETHEMTKFYVEQQEEEWAHFHQQLNP
ncbi:transaldolase family protein [Rhabdochlamydiaceae symbiont of Dictyostelium giganteum]|uniref:transaldolase family protein n=1 Tax=Rhabdochlamydiaceae symbiont of Dictyostelium giganteum TaxID=3342349 RepID=UPI00384E3FE1